MCCNLMKSLRVASCRSSNRCPVFIKWNCYYVVQNFIHHSSFGYLTTLLQRWPAQPGYHSGGHCLFVCKYLIQILLRTDSIFFFVNGDHTVLTYILKLALSLTYNKLLSPFQYMNQCSFVKKILIIFMCSLNVRCSSIITPKYFA